MRRGIDTLDDDKRKKTDDKALEIRANAQQQLEKSFVLLTSVINNPNEETKDRLKAVDLLAKIAGVTLKQKDDFNQVVAIPISIKPREPKIIESS